MKWTEEKSLKLISYYKNYELLWDPTNKFYYNKLRKNIAWQELAEEFSCQEDEYPSPINELIENQDDDSNKNSEESSTSDVPRKQNIQMTNESLTNKTISSKITQLKKKIFFYRRKTNNIDIFGDVARKYRKYNVKTQSCVEYQINNILFQADMGTYEHVTIWKY
ncbi:hypothetical protein P5V15_001224 [Pogonomyrmex californicus]